VLAIPIDVSLATLTASWQLDQKDAAIKLLEAKHKELEQAAAARELKHDALLKDLRKLQEVRDKCASDNLVYEQLLHQERDDNKVLLLEVQELKEALNKSVITVDNHVNR
jgi:Tfp pilus assembly protein PilN